MYIHCADGHGRTGLFTAALLGKLSLANTPDAALRIIQNQRPGVKLSFAQNQTLTEYYEFLGSSETNYQNFLRLGFYRHHDNI